MRRFVDETRSLFKELDEKLPPEPKREVEAPRAKEDADFIPKLKDAPPEALINRIHTLWNQRKEQERMWAASQEFVRKQAEEVATLRAKMQEREDREREQELDNLQTRAATLLNRTHPDYNPDEGAKALRELTAAEQARGQEMQARKEQAAAIQAQQEQAIAQRNVLIQSKSMMDAWADQRGQDGKPVRPYAQPGHPMFEQVKSFVAHAYENAPPHVTVKDILVRAQSIFDKKSREAADSSRPDAPSGKLTVSQVLGSNQGPASQAPDPGSKLSGDEKRVAFKLLGDLYKGDRLKCYAEYARMKGV
jgi:hypothetical protein